MNSNFNRLQVGGGGGGAGGGTGNIGGPLHQGGSGSGSHTPMDIDEGIEIPSEKVKEKFLYFSELLVKMFRHIFKC